MVEVKLKIAKVVIVQRPGMTDNVNIELDAPSAFALAFPPCLTMVTARDNGEKWAREVLGPDVELEVIDTSKQR